MAATDAGMIAQHEAARGGGLKPVLLALFLFAVLLPIRFHVGDFRVDPFRIYLLAGFIPMAIMMLSGRAGRLTLVDGLMVAYALWIVVALTHNHGNWGITNGGITVAELLGGYMLGRLMIRSVADFDRLVRYLIASLVVILPFVVHEFVTGRWLIGELLRPIAPVGPEHSGERLGFTRVQAGFPHPILYGLYASITFACAYYLYRDRVGVMLRRVAFVGVMTFAALSSGPLLSLFVQGGMIVWDRITRGKWMLLGVLAVIGYVVVDFLSNRTPVQIFVQTFTLNPTTAYWRIHIFEYGKQAVLNNPIFGIGHHDHPRPFWLTSSVDNFWLLNAMRYGLVGFGFLAGAMLLNVLNILRLENLSQAARNARLAYLVSFAGLAFTLTTVHVWNSVSSMVFVIFGAGAFLYTGGAGGPAAEAGSDAGGDSAPAAGAARYRRPTPAGPGHSRPAPQPHPQAPPRPDSQPEPRPTPPRHARRDGASGDAGDAPPAAPRRKGPTYRR